MDALTSIITAGVMTAIITGMLALVRIALGAERRRADDWRMAAQTTSAANAVLSTNVDKLVTSVEQMATSQREMMTLLKTSMERMATSQQEILTLLQAVATDQGRAA